MKIAIGIVIAMEKTAQGDSAMAPMTTIHRTAMRMSMIVRTPMIAAVPPTRPSSSRAIWPRERPRRRIDMCRTM